jgi:phage FluMu gp28-like protein
LPNPESPISNPGAGAPALHLYEYQRRWVQDTARFKCAMFARQAGKTFTSTLELVLDCLREESAGKRARWVILSRGERQAREAMNEGVKLHLRALKAGFQEFDYAFDHDVRALEVQTPGGSIVTALPANPDTARGFSANVLLDEFAFHKDSRAIWRALFPVISKPGLKLRVISTPNGKGNKFYELMTGGDGAWSRHTTDIYQAVADGLPRDIDELRRALNDEDSWAQEFELKWLDEASAWLPFELITACEHDAAGDAGKYAGGDVYLGVDIAARNDLFVIWAVERVGDVLWTREIIARRRISFAEQDALLADAMARYRVRGVWIDQTGMGEKPVEDATRKYGSLIHGVLFTAANKQTLATAGKQVFEDRRIRVPLGDDALRADLHKLKKITGPTGVVRFVAESDGAGHADRAWACFLAVSAATLDAGEIDYIDVPTAPRGMFGAGAADSDRDAIDDDMPLLEPAAW